MRVRVGGFVCVVMVLCYYVDMGFDFVFELMRFG